MMEDEQFSSTESSIFEFANEPKDGFTTIKAGTKKPEHIKLNPGKEQAAASSRAAAMRRRSARPPSSTRWRG